MNLFETVNTTQLENPIEQQPEQQNDATTITRTSHVKSKKFK